MHKKTSTKPISTSSIHSSAPKRAPAATPSSKTSAAGSKPTCATAAKEAGAKSPAAKAAGAKLPDAAAKKILPKAKGAADLSPCAASSDTAAPPVLIDRGGQARIIYNHYNSFFPVDSSGKMQWQLIDDEYCLSFGAIHPIPRAASRSMYCLTLPHSVW
jgi:hypothetical protein